MSHLLSSSFGTTTTTATPSSTTSRSSHTNRNTPYNQSTITANRSSPVPINSVNSRTIPQTMNPPIDMKSNNILNPEKDTDTPRGDHLESKASSTSSASGTTATNSNNGNNNNSTGKTQIVFIHKLYDMLHDESISHLIWWSPSLDSFYVTPGEEFSRVLSQYFKHTNIASFIRQLNMYGFHKVNEPFLNQDDQQQQQLQSNRWEFRHSTNQFRKGDTESLKNIKRRSSKTLNAQKEVVNIKSLPPTSHPMEYNTGYSYQNEDSAHYFIHQHSITSMQSPADMRPRSPSTPIPIQSLAQQQQQQLPPQPVPNGPPVFSGPIPPGAVNQSPQEYLTRPSILNNVQGSFENATNFKFVELTNQINLLRNDFFSINNRYELLQNELKYQTADSMAILEILEKLSNDNRITSDVRDLKNVVSQRMQRLGNQFIPQQSNFQPQLAGQQQQQQQQQHSQSLSSNYHLESTSVSRNPSTTNLNVAPQPYALNPHYTIYANNRASGSSEINNGVFRAREDSNNSKRNLSVYDPLQPVPSRNSSRILIEESTPNHPPTTLNPQQPQSQSHIQLGPAMPPQGFRNRAESTYSPLSHSSNKSQILNKAPTPVNHSPLVQQQQKEVKKEVNENSAVPPTQSSQPVTRPLSRQQQQQQQQPLHNPSTTSSRTNSLPNPVAEQPIPQSPYYLQRNSFNTVYEHQKSLRVPSPKRVRYATPPRSIPEQPTSSASATTMITSTSKATSTSGTAISRNDNHSVASLTAGTLPSVSELDKSIRTGNSVSLPPIKSMTDNDSMNDNGNGNDNENDHKKRKLE
ncbi:flocculation suppression protein, putative [Candida dubliniensis CD36]|uniref:Flocculation suppression protein, putative n=1 Tax=Candida dubliniensis (strain CD36 / ATCC MYA-646 / CBS 7987 / NCPF 3949 / NRRL Y-17841) TaxID=573826 RepID=B9WM15_CANDC|nr:flocculation suppression protein, putative [Candida dubliniensis CD36]CAX40128.1 flocculation suppression protein, putative [Candida dubliniensis CD36]